MVTNGRLLFVLVENGLETYTARPWIAALHNSTFFDNIQQVSFFIPHQRNECLINPLPGDKFFRLAQIESICRRQIKCFSKCESCLS